MTRHQIRLTLRPVPRLIRAWRWWRYPDGVHTTATSEPRRDIWFRAFVPYRLRAAHRWYAHRCGRFWQPCPLCGNEFGGHEWRDMRGLPSSVPDPFEQPAPGSPARMSVGICPRCTAAGRGVRV